MNPLLRWLLLLIGTASLQPGRARAEGSKQFTPNTTGITTVLSDPTNTRSGYPSHDVNTTGGHQERAGLSSLNPFGFAFNGVAFPEKYRVFVRVKAGETLLYGVHHVNSPIMNANQRDPILTLRFGAGACSRLWLTPTANLRCSFGILFSLAEICPKQVLVKADS